MILEYSRKLFNPVPWHPKMFLESLHSVSGGAWETWGLHTLTWSLTFHIELLHSTSFYQHLWSINTSCYWKIRTFFVTKSFVTQLIRCSKSSRFHNTKNIIIKHAWIHAKFTAHFLCIIAYIIFPMAEHKLKLGRHWIASEL